MITKTEAIRSLAPGAKFTNVHDVITWYSDDIAQPSDSDVDAEIVRLQAEYDSQEYARNRQEEYPSLNELIVALWENVVEERAASVVSIESKRQAIKAKYPK